MTSLANSVAVSTFAPNSDEGRTNRAFLEYELADHPIAKDLEIQDVVNLETQRSLQFRLTTYLAEFTPLVGRRTLAARLFTQAGVLPLGQDLPPRMRFMVGNLILEVSEKDLALTGWNKRWHNVKRCGAVLLAQSP